MAVMYHIMLEETCVIKVSVHKHTISFVRVEISQHADEDNFMCLVPT